MIKGEPLVIKGDILKPAVNYRSLPALNQSMLKLFDSDPVKFYNEFKLGKKRKQTRSTAMIIGDLVDFFILECQADNEVFLSRFDEQFSLMEDQTGSGQAIVLADLLYDITQNYTDENNIVITSFEARFSEAVRQIQKLGKYKGKSEVDILQDFTLKGKKYFDTLMLNHNKTVVDVSLVDKSMTVSKNILEDEFTKDIFIEEEHIEFFQKLPIEWIYTSAEGDNVTCKAEVDLLKLDHGNKIIYLYDLKTTYDNENFEYNYIKNGYYLQSAFYYKAVQYWANKEGLENYTIVPMEFIVGDTSSNNRRPIRYKTTKIDLDKGENGFVLRGTTYRGVNELISEIIWSEKNDTWNVSKYIVKNKGIVGLNLNYE